MLRKSLICIATAFAVAAPTLAPADDTDIYISPLRKTGSEPLVMFAFDVRPSTGNTGQFPSGSTTVQYFASQAGTCNEFANSQRPAGVTCSGTVGTKTSISDLKDFLRLSLKVALYEFQGKGVKVGMMTSNAHSSSVGLNQPGESSGGTILYGFNTLGTDNVARLEIDARLNKLNELVVNGSTTHSYQPGEMMFELYRYLTGKPIYNGHNGCDNFGTNDNAGNCPGGTGNKNAREEHCPACWDDTVPADGRVPDGFGGTNPHPGQSAVENAANTSYVSPLIGGSCSKVYTIHFQNGQSNQDSDSNTAISLSYANGGLAIPNPPNQPAAQVISKMRQLDFGSATFGLPDIAGEQNVTSYFLYSGQAGPEANSLAAAGGTGTAIDYTAVDYGLNPSFVVDIISKVLRQILDVSTTFVAASAPVNVFNRTQTLDSLYLALFQPDPDAKPCWAGNVKKLRLNNQNVIVGADNQPAINPLNGRIDDDSTSYWTDTSKLPIGSGRVRTGEAMPIAPATTPITDGRQVNRGGAGQRIPGLMHATDREDTGAPGNDNTGTNRKVFYDSGASTLSDLDTTLDTNGPLQTALGTSGDQTATAKLLRYMRGQDVNDEDVDSNITEARRWMMGDPLHSRPLPINYGAIGSYTTANPGIFVAVTTNGGHLHFIRNTTTGGAESGQEEWAFIPRKVMGVQKTLMDNVPVVPAHPYAFDGSPIAYVLDNNQDGTINGSDKVYLFLGMRRGGRGYYGLDITNPLLPTLMWSIDESTTGFSELGYSFSAPRVGKLKHNGTSKLALFFGGGYSLNKDNHTVAAGTDTPKANPTIGSSDTIGNAIFVVDAISGGLIWKATSGIDDSIPSDVGIFDTDYDGHVDRVLVGDTGGKVWRADFPWQSGATTVDWRLTQIANLGRHDTGGKANDRRFFNAPVLVQTFDASNTPYDAVLIGSGDREDPLDRIGVANNYFYMIRDPYTAVLTAASTVTGMPRTQAQIADLSDNCMMSSSCSSATIANMTNGWRFLLEEGASGTSEKNLAVPLVVAGIVYFTTYLPPTATIGTDQTCGPAEGTGLLYAVNLKDATPAYNYDGIGDSKDTPNEKGDRSDNLADNFGGIPAQVVYLSTNAQDCLLRPDLKCETPSSSSFRPTFWRRFEQAP